MAETSKQPWRCHWCRRLNKHHAPTCGSCYLSWEKCIDIHYIHGKKAQPHAQSRQGSRRTRQGGAWENWDQWDSAQEHGHQQRQVTPSPRRKPRGKTPKKRNEKQKAYGTPALDPPWQPTPAASHPVHTQAASSQSEAAESRLLQELVQAIETSDKPVSAEIQNVIDKAKKPIEPPTTTKSVRQAWDKLEKKRKQLQQAQVARSNLHRSWADYIEESVKRWKTFAADFAQKDEVLEKKVQDAKDAMQEAKDKYDTAREAIDKQDALQLEQPEELSDYMEEETLDKMATSEEIQAGINSMVNTLEAVRIRPQEDLPDAQAAKKAKTGHGDGAMEPSLPGSGALQPFAKPGK